MKLYPIIAVAALLATPAMASDVANTPARLREIKQEVADVLREPPSAYFRQVEVRRINNTENLVVCGMVSGRNAMGGMGDAVPFYYLSRPVLVDSTSQLSGMQAQMWQQVCQGQSQTVTTLIWNR